MPYGHRGNDKKNALQKFAGHLKMLSKTTY